MYLNYRYSSCFSCRRMD